MGFSCSSRGCSEKSLEADSFSEDDSYDDDNFDDEPPSPPSSFVGSFTSSSTVSDGERRRRSRRLQKIPRKNYSFPEPDPSEDSEESSSDYEFEQLQRQFKQIRKPKRGKHVCPYSQCGERFTSIKVLSNHYITHVTDDVVLKCDIGSCGRIFGNLLALERHKKDEQ